MKISNRSYFITLVRKIPSFANALFYIGVRNKWSTEELGAHIDSEILSHLTRLGSKKAPIKVNNPNRAFFIQRFGSFDIAVQIAVAKNIAKSKLELLQNRLNECNQSATTQFQANHDELTGIFNRHGLRNELLRLSKPTTSENLSESSTQEPTNLSSVSLFSIDVDRFKSVNDTYGHEVGDLVLCALSKRLSSLAEDLADNFSAKFIVGRPGGEEFDLIAVGSITPKQITQIAERLLEAVRSPGLPSPEEVKFFGKQNLNQNSYPNATTISVGVASARTGEKDHYQIYQDLRSQSDKALYRAKTDGRNRHRIFSEIRNKHGRVLKHHTDSNLVEIDIGSNVNVMINDVYNVCFPPFNGETAILERDSNKRLGTYPKIATATIAVIDVQKEVSICAVLDNKQNVSIPANSLIVRVNNGSQFLSIDRKLSSLPIVQQSADFLEFIDQNVQDQNLAIVGRLKCLQRAGDMRPHSVISKEVTAIASAFLPSRTAFYSRPNSGFYFAIPNEDGIDLDETEDKLESLVQALNELKMTSTIFKCSPSKLPETVSKSAESLLFYCHCVSKDRNEENESILEFSEANAYEILSFWRRQSDLDSALIDSQVLMQKGWDSAYAYNQLGLIVLENQIVDYYGMAEMVFRKARSMVPDMSPFSANLGNLLVLQGRFGEAFDIFRKITKYLNEKDGVYLVPYARSVVENLDKLPKEESSALLIAAVEHLQTVGSTDPQEKEWEGLFKMVLATGEFG